MTVKTKITQKTVRITLDLPYKLHTQIKTLASQNGETLRQLFIGLTKAEIANKKLKTTQKTLRKMPIGVKLGITDQDLNQIISNTWLPKF